MKQYASLPEEKREKFNQALNLFVESVIEPDSKLRSEAYHDGCLEELMEIREHVLEYLKTLRLK